jgi:hypothetical protein
MVIPQLSQVRKVLASFMHSFATDGLSQMAHRVKGAIFFFDPPAIVFIFFLLLPPL